MNNEDKRFKTINRIATPIKVESTPKESENVSSNIDEQVRQSTNAIPPKKEVVKKKKTQKPLNKDIVVKFLIVIFVIGIIASSVYLFIPKVKNNKKITYNDITTTTTTASRNGNFFRSTKLSESDFLEEGIDYSLGEFTIKKINNSVYVNNKEITSKERVYSTIGLVDDLLVFTASNNQTRTRELYVIDMDGKVILDMYHIGDINGMVIADESDAVIYNSAGITLVVKNVINDTIIPNNKIGSSNPTSICNEDELFASSIETNKPVIVYYSLVYKGSHEFGELESIYTESIEEYKNKNNYCR